MKFLQCLTTERELVAVVVNNNSGKEFIFFKTPYSQNFSIIGGGQTTLPDIERIYTIKQRLYKGDRVEIEL